jgi:WD40 repeat protein
MCNIRFYILSPENSTFLTDLITPVRKILGNIGDGFGEIYAIALSPDDQYLAVGGYLDEIREYRYAIRIYHFPTGQLRRILKSHSKALYDLSFSADNRYLVSGSGDCSVKIWDARNDFNLIHTFKEHQKQVYAVRIFPYKGDYRIVSAAYDNQVILYSLNQKKQLASFSHQDKTDSFAVSRKYIASAGYDYKINIFDHDLKHIRSIDSETRPEGLAFSPDGKLLLAGAGDYPDYCDVYDTEQNFKQIQSFKEHTNIVQAVAFSDNDTAITGGGNNFDIYFWNPRTGKTKGHIAGDSDTIWAVGVSGDTIAFGNSVISSWQNNNYGNLEKAFDLSKFKAYASKDFSKFQRISERYENYTLSHEKGGDYGYKDAVLLIQKNGQTVSRIVRNSTNGLRHNTYGFTADGTIISGGSQGFLKAYNPEGEQIADFIGHTGEIWSIATYGDRLVSGGTDQIIKLWDLKELKQGNRKILPILSLFVSKDNEWVVWTEEGFFNASPGGAKYIGYHINRGQDKTAEYIRVDQLYQQFYRPDLVSKRLKGGYEKEIQAELSKIGNIQSIISSSGLPPELEALHEKEVSLKSRDFTLNLKLNDKGGGIGKIVYRVDGSGIEGMDARPAPPPGRAPGLTPEGVRELARQFSLPHGRHVISVTAYNADNKIESAPVEILVNVNDPMTQPPDLYALCIGISDYPEYKLKYAADDAVKIAESLKQGGQSLFNRTDIRTLTDKAATLEGINAAFVQISEKIKQSDVFVLYLAGHGMALDGNYHFLPQNFRYTNDDAVRQKSLSANKLRDLLSKINSLKSLVILDTCAAGSFSTTLASIARGNYADKTAISRLMNATGRNMLAATSDEKYALEGYENHGVFTYALLQGLKGEADRDGNNSVDINELAAFVEEKVPEITQKLWKYEQIPMNMIKGKSFPIGCREGTRCKSN